MGLKSDNWIRHMSDRHSMIEPFEGGQIRHSSQGSVLSYGTSSYAYDLRCAPHFKIVSNMVEGPIDPKDFDINQCTDVRADVCVVPAHTLVLAFSLEKLRIPVGVVGLCIPKSTYTRCGLMASTTLLNAGWEGQVSIELFNTTPVPIKVYAQEGIVQLLFVEGDDKSATNDPGRHGRYHRQQGFSWGRRPY